MKKKLTKVLSIILACILLTVNIEAANFKDVKQNHWAKSYIEKCADLGFINGYTDGSFKPDGSIKFLELLKMVSNLLNVSESEMQTAESIYGAQLNKLQPATWARPYILKCLQKGVINMDTINTAAKTGNPSMIKDKAQNSSSRSDTAIIFAKAMGLQPVPTSLSYNDSSEINDKVIPYIGALQKVGVLNPKGNDKGMFRPKDPLSRAEVSKMLSIAYDYVSTHGNSGNSGSMVVPTQPNKTVTGTFKNTFSSYITIADAIGNLKVYSYPASVTKTLNGAPTFDSNIVEGMEVTLTLQGDTVIRADFKQVEKTIDSVIKEVPSRSYNVKFEYKENNKTQTITLDVQNATITLDGNKATIDDLKEGYEAKVTYKMDKAIKLDAKRNQNFAGFFEEFRSSGREMRVYYKPEYNSRKSDYYVLNEYVYLNKSNKSVRATDLVRSSNTNPFVKGQPINFEFDRSGKSVTGVYYEFDSRIKDGHIFGYIAYDVNSTDNKISVSPKNYKSSTKYDIVDLDLDRNVYVNINGRDNRISNLRRDMLVNITMKDGYVYEIEVINSTGITSGYEKGIFSGELVDVDTRNHQISFDTYNAPWNNDNNLISEGVNTFEYDERTKFYIDNKAYSLYDFEYNIFSILDKDYYNYQVTIKTGERTYADRRVVVLEVSINKF
ncbi:MAG: S-layer homology domain-containing protein [Ezakiella sp.]|nr:S-layer homology domain-containing protein [Ezakiella sp.]MDD7471193.1 S-layer homology domain-containing protein [Bacillota bacterium]MDY3923461.1 S-layer homology domain-containing protein [Ezakiella sp.]